MKKSSLSIVVAVVLLSIPACDGKDTAQRVWSDIVQRCSSSDLLSKDVLYFGPSNIGPGSVWRKGINGGYNVRWLTSRYIDPPSQVINTGPSWSCGGTLSASSKISPAAVLESLVAPITGQVQADFKRARKITVTVDSLQQMDLLEGDYETKVKGLDPNDPVRQDLNQGDRFIIGRAFLVRGMVATLEFDRETAISLSGKYRGPIAGSPGNVGASLTGNWTSETTLEVRSAADFFIAGELRRFESGGLSATGHLVGSAVKDVRNVTVGTDPTM